MTTSTVRRRARALALVMAGGAITVGVLAGRQLLVADTSSIDGVWSSALLAALTLTSCWATAVALLARREIGRPARAGSGRECGTESGSKSSTEPTRLLAVALLAVAGWTAAGSPASATPVSAATPIAATATAIAPTITALTITAPAVPSPDFAPAPAERTPAAPRCESAQAAPEPGWTPSRPPAVAPADASPLVMACPSPARGTSGTTPVVVHRGDSLWSIVARTLGPDASAARIAHELPAWHAANRAVIGDDPNLLLAGQILHSPTKTATTQGNS